MFLKKLVCLCLALISFGLTSVRVISGDILPDVTTDSYNNRKRPPPLSLWSETDELSSLGSPVLTNEVRRIAIIGGGGAGSVTAILLSNLSKQARRYGLKFEITIFERNNELITGSAFEIAAVLHAGGCEYPEDIATIADCKEFGALFEQMFPGLYDNSLPIMYFTRTGSNLTSAMQQKAHKMAKKRGKNRGSLKSPKGKSSQHELSPKEVQGVFGLNISGGVRSTKDKSMKIFERNARIKKCIERDHEITVKTSTCVSNYVKNADGTFCVMVDGKPTGQPFHDLLLTTWDDNQSIADASESSFDLGFTAEDRVIALCDISGVPHLQNTPFMIYGAIEKEDIEDEKLKLFKNFKRTESGKSYQSKLHDASPLRRRALTDPWVVVVASDCSDNNSTSPVSVLELPQPVNKARSDSFIDRELSSPLNSSFDLMVSNDSPKIKLENPSGRRKQMRNPVSRYKDDETSFISFGSRDPAHG